jgi:hypothetical protein
MAKKPPPGATLIARLRESKLKREQELQDRIAERTQGKKEQKEKATKVSKISETIEVLPPENQTKTSDNLPTKTKSLTTKASITKPQPTDKGKSTVSGKQLSTMKSIPLIRREFTIEDLRPFTDDYIQLTEEIRLAGRFAAAGLIAQGLRLALLKDDQLYKQHYTTFEDYCRQELTMSATYAYRLIRMAEMAERLAEEGLKNITDLGENMPDPFEVMLDLGHRHMLALLPLETQTAEELLVKGIPIPDANGRMSERIPIFKATEQQIREAIKLLAPKDISTSNRSTKTNSKNRPPKQQSVKSISDAIGYLQAWIEWLETEPEDIKEKIGDGRERASLRKRLDNVSDKLKDLL